MIRLVNLICIGIIIHGGITHWACETLTVTHHSDRFVVTKSNKNSCALFLDPHDDLSIASE